MEESRASERAIAALVAWGLEARRRLTQLIAHESARCLVQGALVLFLYVWIRPHFVFLARLPHSWYQAPYVLAKSLAHPERQVLLGLGTGLLLLTRTGLRWRDVEHGKILRIFLCGTLGALAWGDVLYGFNYYLGQAHYWDRLTVLALWGATWLSPTAFPLALFHTFTMHEQRSVPMASDKTDWLLVFNVLFLFVTFMWASLGRRIKGTRYVALALTLIGAFYFSTGISKVTLGRPWAWVLDNSLANMFVSAYTHGWLGFLSEEAVSKTAQLIDSIQIPAALAVVLLEMAGVLLLLRRRVTIGLLIAFSGLHLAIFATTGILFWKWIVMNLLLAYALSRFSDSDLRAIFAPRILVPVASVLVILFLRQRAFNPPKLAWFTVPISRVYHVEAEGTGGKRYEVPSGFFTPLSKSFAQDDFFYLDNERHIGGIYSGAPYELYVKALGLDDPNKARDLIQRSGKVQARRDTRDKMVGFLTRYFENYNRLGARMTWMLWVDPPLHIWTQHDGLVYRGQDRVKRVRIWMERKLYTKGRLVTLSPRRDVLEIEIPQP